MKGDAAAEGKTMIPFGRAWLGKPAILAALLAFGVLLAAFLNRCYIAMPWDQWAIAGIPVAYWRKPIAAGLFMASIWGVAICSGCLFWWFVSWVTGAGWSAGLRRVWENWANAGWGVWMMLTVTGGIMTTVLFPWADRERRPSGGLSEQAWFFNTDAYWGREIFYILLFLVLAMVVRSCSLKGDSLKPGRVDVHDRRMVLLSALALPFVVVAQGMMGIDWVGGLTEGFIPSMWPLYMVACMGAAGLAASAVTAAASRRYGAGARTGLEQGHLGALMLVVLLFKAYFGYSQFMITLYGGIPMEQAFYDIRLVGDWYRVAQACAVGGVLLPVLFLLLPCVRRSPFCLMAAGIWVLVWSAVEVCWMMAPAMGFEAVDPMLIQAFGAGLVIVVLLLAISLLSSMSHYRCFAVDHHGQLSSRESRRPASHE